RLFTNTFTKAPLPLAVVIFSRIENTRSLPKAGGGPPAPGPGPPAPGPGPGARPGASRCKGASSRRRALRSTAPPAGPPAGGPPAWAPAGDGGAALPASRAGKVSRVDSVSPRLTTPVGA